MCAEGPRKSAVRTPCDVTGARARERREGDAGSLSAPLPARTRGNGLRGAKKKRKIAFSAFPNSGATGSGKAKRRARDRTRDALRDGRAHSHRATATSWEGVRLKRKHILLCLPYKPGKAFDRSRSLISPANIFLPALLEFFSVRRKGTNGRGF